MWLGFRRLTHWRPKHLMLSLNSPPSPGQTTTSTPSKWHFSISACHQAHQAGLDSEALHYLSVCALCFPSPAVMSLQCVDFRTARCPTCLIPWKLFSQTFMNPCSHCKSLLPCTRKKTGKLFPHHKTTPHSTSRLRHGQQWWWGFHPHTHHRSHLSNWACSICSPDPAQQQHYSPPPSTTVTFRALVSLLDQAPKLIFSSRSSAQNWARLILWLAPGPLLLWITALQDKLQSLPRPNKPFSSSCADHESEADRRNSCRIAFVVGGCWSTIQCTQTLGSATAGLSTDLK